VKMLSRPRRSSAAATADKISASIKEQASSIEQHEDLMKATPKTTKASKASRPITGNDAAESKPKKAKHGKSSAVVTTQNIDVIDITGDTSSKSARFESKPKNESQRIKANDAAESKPKKAKHGKSLAVVTTQSITGDTSNNVMLLGYFISKCVGIQHYGGSGTRYNKEPLHLRRDPNNPYDRNAIAVRTIGGKQVGHMQRVDALAVARVADDKTMTIRMVAQVESGAHQTFKFPLRVSFFGVPAARSKVAGHLLHTGWSSNMYGAGEMGGGIVLKEPKRRGRGHGRGGKMAVISGVRSSGNAPLEDEAAVAADDDNGEIEVMGERSWHERDQELRKHAIELE